MLDRTAYKKFLQRNLDKIFNLVIDSLIHKRERCPAMLDLVLIEAHGVLHTRQFNCYKPENEDAWEVLSRPIRVAVEFEFQRIHLVALIFQKLNDHSLEEFIIGEESKAMRMMVI